jgi:hypothetical protein
MKSNVTEKMSGVEVGIDEALRIGKVMRDALLAEWEGLEKLDVEQMAMALTRHFDVLELLGEIDLLLRARVLPLQVAHHKATLLSRPPGDKLQ